MAPTMPRLPPLLLSCLVCLVPFASAGTGAKDHYRSTKPIEKRYTAQQVIKQLKLQANPEKGYFAETFRDTYLVGSNGTDRSAGTAIYYLIEGRVGDSLWHRLDAAEVWHYYAGAPMKLELSHNNGTGVRKLVMGPDVFDHQSPQVVIASWEWQRVRSYGEWTLVGTTVSPGFDPTQYEIEDEGWNPT